MTDREKLIELMEQAYYCSIEELADHLIANGVVVREKGEWEPVFDRWGDHREGEVYAPMWRCPVCGEENFYSSFCPNWGADMRGRENG